MNLADVRVDVRPGAGIVARFRGVLVFVASQEGAVPDLLDACATSAGPVLGQRLAQLLRASEVPAFCVLTDSDDGIAGLSDSAASRLAYRRCHNRDHEQCQGEQGRATA